MLYRLAIIKDIKKSINNKTSLTSKRLSNPLFMKARLIVKHSPRYIKTNNQCSTPNNINPV